MKKLLSFIFTLACFLGTVSAQNPTLIYSSNGVKQTGGPVGKVTLEADGSVVRTNQLAGLTNSLPFVRNDILNNQTGGVKFVSGNVIGSSFTVVTNMQQVIVNQPLVGRPNATGTNVAGFIAYWPSGDFFFTGQAEGGGGITTNFNGSTNNIVFWGYNEFGNASAGKVGPDGRTQGWRMENNYQYNAGGGVTSTNYEYYLVRNVRGGQNRYCMFSTDDQKGAHGATQWVFKFGQGSDSFSGTGSAEIGMSYGSGGESRFTYTEAGNIQLDVTPFSSGTLWEWKPLAYNFFGGQVTADVGISYGNVFTNGTYAPSSNPALLKKVWNLAGGTIATLPQASESAFGATRNLLVQDRYGSAGVSVASNITILPAANQRINGSTNAYVISRNGGCAYFWSLNNTNWSVVADGSLATSFATTSTNSPTMGQWYTNGLCRKQFTVSFTCASTVAAKSQVDFYMVSGGNTNVFGTVGIPSGVIENSKVSHTVFAQPGASYCWSNSSEAGASAAIGTYFEWSN